MRNPATVGMTGLTGLVLLLSWHESQQPVSAVRDVPAAAAGVITRTTSAAPRTAAPAVRASRVPIVHDVVVNGAPADTRYGPVQVQITLRSGQILRADAIDYPQSNERDQRINRYAVPKLDDETLQAQSAQIDTVSGATYTSDGYSVSLQSALDAAHKAGEL